jgi:23S rRNA (guanine2445-N2)-methyltransferase / 23S rRNA (guanine2069-N7)-methyltransferase
LRKTARHRAKWARRAEVSCYRVYDADLPDYNVAIDVYNGATGTPDEGRRWLHIAEYAPPAHIDASKAQERLVGVLALAPEILGVSASDVFLKQRKRSKGGRQYAELAQGQSKAGCHYVSEAGLLFEIDLASHLDTGIFLDHRDTRMMLQGMAAGRDALNLFAYTGTASAHMAAGGAASVATVDLSASYLDVARRNMAANGFKGERFSFEQADVLRWVGEHRHSESKFGLIFCDPPTFSNSSSMGKRSWDVQRDHGELLIALSRMLAASGVVVFSTNLRGFKPDEALLAKAGVELEDVTARTIPEDFRRPANANPVHRCYIARRTGR